MVMDGGGTTVGGPSRLLRRTPRLLPMHWGGGYCVQVSLSLLPLGVCVCLVAVSLLVPDEMVRVEWVQEGGAGLREPQQKVAGEAGGWTRGRGPDSHEYNTIHYSTYSTKSQSQRQEDPHPAR